MRKQHNKVAWWRGAALALSLLIVLLPSVARAQSGSATLSVQVTVQSSIGLTFSTSTGGCSLVPGSGSNNVSLDLGSGSLTGPSGGPGGYTGCATWHSMPGGWQQVASPVNISVTKANSNSASYSLGVWVNTAPTPKVRWVLNPNAQGVGINLTTSSQVVNASLNYGTLTQTVAFQENAATAGVYSQTIYFLATAN